MTTDDQGYFRFEDVASVQGSVWCSVAEQGAASMAAELEFGPGPGGVFLELDLEARGVFWGSVRGPDGTPVAYAQIWFVHLTADDKMGWASGAKTEMDGSFRRAIEAGKYQVILRASKHADPTLGPRVVVEAGLEVQLSLELP